MRQTGPMWLDYEGLAPSDLRRIQAPTLVFTGDRDEMFHLELIVSLYRALPNAELAVCPHADHYAPVTREGARPFARTVADFAARHGLARGPRRARSASV